MIIERTYDLVKLIERGRKAILLQNEKEKEDFIEQTENFFDNFSNTKFGELLSFPTLNGTKKAIPVQMNIKSFVLYGINDIDEAEVFIMNKIPNENSYIELYSLEYFVNEKLPSLFAKQTI